MFWSFVGSFTVLLGLMLYGLYLAAGHQPEFAAFGLIAKICCFIAAVSEVTLLSICMFFCLII